MENNQTLEKAYLASGCFWGSEFQLKRLNGVVATRVGYMGGSLDNPTYEDVCSGETGHLETVEVLFDTTKIDYATVLRRYFETHDFSQTNGQGPDIGSQYLSVVFAANDEQKAVTERIIIELQGKGYKVATQIGTMSTFWEAELYHQNYYDKKGGRPYCHVWRKIF